jgi:L-alanine-DL-glutamate epimerase-like enolase superfamily enzyme
MMGKPVRKFESMPIITEVRSFILHVPVTRNDIADSVHRITHWGVPGAIIRTDAGIDGYGFSGTHAHLATDRLIASCITDAFGPLLIGKEATDVSQLWEELAHYPPIQWVGRCGITHLALGAIDVALWDIKTKHASQPLWKYLGGNATKKVEGYNTDGGWLNWPMETLVSDCRRLTEIDGYPGVKIKVGSSEPGRDLKRIEAVRRAIGPKVKLMVDANGKFDLAAAISLGQRLRDFNVVWFEEPLWYDDVAGHAELARQIDTPIALGEQLYRLDDFRNFVAAGAVHFVQPDVTRVAGITEWRSVADLAARHQLPVASHVGDMAQVHQHLAIAHPACSLLEYIPWTRQCFREPAAVRDGAFVTPQEPGAGTTLRADALEKFAVG